ncbi:hypothetical protein LCGC14_2363290 [marine sediment metagenome]|uniref:Uncharacterized protein n=1 Tax=marine sediment metagenome TaxID=412755 RepID=A0A0F9CTD3_9ZZZZ
MKWYEDPVYIQQCEKAVEVQNEREATIGNVYYDMIDDRAYTLGATRKDGIRAFTPLQVSLENDSRYTWLPTQSQLQAMVEVRGGLGVWDLFKQFGDWCGEWGGESGHFATGEQLWLGFLMHEKYQKRWAGEDWE